MQDLRHALHLFVKSPGFTVAVVLILALGIRANTAVFSIIYGALLRPLPYKNPDRLINILDTSIRESELAKIFASYSDFEEFSRHARTSDSVAADTWAGRPAAVLTDRGPTRTYFRNCHDRCRCNRDDAAGAPRIARGSNDRGAH